MTVEEQQKARKIEELKQQHGNDLTELEYEGHSFIFRKPKRQEYDRWLQRSNEDRTSAARELAQSCIVSPSAQEMFELIDLYPALLQAPNGFVDVITELAGLSKTGVLATKKKL